MIAHMINLRASSIGGENFRISVDPAGSVADAVAKLYEAMWANLDVNEWEARWIECVIGIVDDKSKDGTFLRLDAPLSSVPIEDGDQLSFVTRRATEQERADRIRGSRVRLSRRKIKLQPKELRSQLFSRDLILKAAAALRQGHQVSGFHTLHCKLKSGGQFQIEGWSWTLLFDPAGQLFVWRHQERSGGEVIDECWSTDEKFVDWWSQMSEQTICAYSGLLIYPDRLEAALLEGTPMCTDFIRLR